MLGRVREARSLDGVLFGLVFCNVNLMVKITQPHYYSNFRAGIGNFGIRKA